MTIPTFNIECKEDIKNFFSWLVNNELLLHPDDSFTFILDFADDENPDDITMEQAEYLDEVMDKCFEVCDEYGFDIYDMAYNMAKDND